jgi:hypothetical protein
MIDSPVQEHMRKSILEETLQISGGQNLWSTSTVFGNLQHFALLQRGEFLSALKKTAKVWKPGTTATS